jgi:uncharacterized protein DUF4331
MKRIVLVSMSVLALVALVAVAGRTVYASDHDDGETDLKARALNLSDHFAFKSPADPTKLSMIMYFNPRSLPGKQYALSTKARYEFHVTKVADKTTTPTSKDDFVFRFEAGAPNLAGVQPITLTVLKDGVEVGKNTGATTTIAASKASATNPAALTTNTGTVGGIDVKYFVGPRADSFAFDVVRFFQVRAFLAARFFGGPGGTTGDATAALADNCRGDKFLALGAETNPDNDTVNLWNPPSCAPDFTKNLNVTAIVLNVPIAALGGGTITVFDTWSTISVTE